MLTGQVCSNMDKNSYLALRYEAESEVYSVPTYMSIWAAIRFRQACEDTASLDAPQLNKDAQIIVDQSLVQIFGSTKVARKGLLVVNKRRTRTQAPKM